MFSASNFSTKQEQFKRKAESLGSKDGRESPLCQQICEKINENLKNNDQQVKKIM